MKILVKRVLGSRHYTLGSLLIDGVWQCYTLEDETRDGAKVPGETSIPPGVYQVVVDQSVRFGRLMPHILDVPGFTGVRIHKGNTAADTEGCILLGARNSAAGVISDSKAAYDPFFAKLCAALNAGERVTLEVV